MLSKPKPQKIYDPVYTEIGKGAMMDGMASLVYPWYVRDPTVVD